jgi:predicted transcriptional regulator
MPKRWSAAGQTRISRLEKLTAALRKFLKQHIFPFFKQNPPIWLTEMESNLEATAETFIDKDAGIQLVR